MKQLCPFIDLTPFKFFSCFCFVSLFVFVCFSLPTLHRNISTHVMCLYEIRVFEPRIETNFSCTKLLASIKYY